MTVMMEGRPAYEKVMQWAKAEASVLKDRPTLAAILTKDDETSKVYVGMKGKDCAAVGIRSEVYDIFAKEKEEHYERHVLELIRKLNEMEDVHGILVQLPLSPRLDEEKIFDSLYLEKDVDCLTPHNLGKLMKKEYDERSFIPCTPKGIMRLLDHYKVHLEGKDAVIIGRSFLVGEPLRKLLQDRDATATCLHSKSRGMEDKIKNADIVVAAAGRPPELSKDGFRLTGEMIKSGSIVIGVGVRKHGGKMYFDVDVESVQGKASYVTPNIGGVGLMTRACLLENTINAAKRLS